MEKKDYHPKIGFSHLKCLNHLLKTYYTIDLIAFLDDLLNQNIDFIHLNKLKDNQTSVFLDACLILVSLISAKLNLTNLSSKNLAVYQERIENHANSNKLLLNFYSLSHQINKIFNRIDKIDNFARVLKTTYENEILESPIIQKEATSKDDFEARAQIFDDLLMQQICVCFLLPGGYGEAILVRVFLVILVPKKLHV